MPDINVTVNNATDVDVNLQPANELVVSVTPPPAISVTIDQGRQGPPGATGDTRIEVYQVAASQPVPPTGGSFDPATGNITPPVGWSAELPANPAGLVWTSYAYWLGDYGNVSAWSNAGLQAVATATLPAGNNQGFVFSSNGAAAVTNNNQAYWDRANATAVFYDLTVGSELVATNIFADDVVITNNLGNTGVLIQNTGNTLNVRTPDNTADANITAGYYFGNGSQLSGIGGTPGGANTQLQFNNAGSFGGSPAVTIDRANAQLVAYNLSVPFLANITSAIAQDITLSTDINNSGVLIESLNNSFMVMDISGTQLANAGANYYYGNGRFLSGIVTNEYSNANVAAFLASNANIDINIQGNVSANYYYGNGAFLTGIATGNGVITPYFRFVAASNAVNQQFSNAAIANIGNANAFSVFKDGGLLQSGIDYTKANDTITVTAYTYANSVIEITPTGASGNAQGGGGTNYSNADVAAYLPTYTGNLAQSSDIIALYANAVTQSTTIAAINANVISANNNIALANANIAALQAAQYSDSNVANYLPTYTGNLAGGNMVITQSAVIQGNLQVLGTTTTINANSLSINDIYLTVANNATSNSLANGAGVIVGDSNIANFRYISTPGNDRWVAWPALQTPGNVTANFFVGNIRTTTGGYNDTNLTAYLAGATGFDAGRSVWIGPNAQGSASALRLSHNGGISRLVAGSYTAGTTSLNFIIDAPDRILTVGGQTLALRSNVNPLTMTAPSIGIIASAAAGISTIAANTANITFTGGNVSINTPGSLYSNGNIVTPRFFLGNGRALTGIAVSNRTPASATAAGVAGEIIYDADYVYVCIATNTWRRANISTW